MPERRADLALFDEQTTSAFVQREDAERSPCVELHPCAVVEIQDARSRAHHALADATGHVSDGDLDRARVVKGTETFHASCAAPSPPSDIAVPVSHAASPLASASPPTSRTTTVAVAIKKSTEVRTKTVDDPVALLQQADAERRAGRVAAARAALLDLRKRFASSASASQAAFDLGVLAFDLDGNFTDAVRWFRRYLDEAPGGPLAREALGRIMEAQQRSGESAAAEASAARYLGRYPGGPHAALAKRLVAHEARGAHE